MPHIPGILPGIWGIMAALGIVEALVLQFLLISMKHLQVGPWGVVSLGAKGCYIFLYRQKHLINRWCIQGFMTGATVTATTLLFVLGVPAGIFLDTAAPGLLLAMTIGRIGCFFAGCCGGPPTASCWESILALSLGMDVLIAVVNTDRLGVPTSSKGWLPIPLGDKAFFIYAPPRVERNWVG